MIDPTFAALAGKLTEAQRRVLIAARPLIDARVLVPYLVERKKWPDQLIDTYSVAFRRLTPLGLALAHHLRTQGGE